MLEPQGLYNHGMQLAECIRNSSIRAGAVYKFKFVCRQVLHPPHLPWRQNVAEYANESMGGGQ